MLLLQQPWSPSLPLPRETLIDSGVVVNLINSTLLEKLQLSTIPCTPPLRVMAVNNEPIGKGYLYLKTKPLMLTIGLFHTEQITMMTMRLCHQLPHSSYHPGATLVTAPRPLNLLEEQRTHMLVTSMLQILHLCRSTSSMPHYDR
ncbi:hypothetical protein QTP70_012751 [Hemibagrus guttatus]|uniref:Uncharacterized protein n=1 Tax=Hemibagrus guttatus TaxID=175788 RepID=A0AAE0QYU7_9TELE|nr:hypothetical protein QTP70_012751 [Hemibagrus guttatus]